MCSWVGRVPGQRRGPLCLAVVIVADSQSLNSDVAEDRFEGKRACSPKLDAGVVFAVPVQNDQFPVSLLHEDLEEPALDFETSLMNERFDLVGEVLILIGHGQDHLQTQLK
jgi:hypothetical protein